MVWCYDNPYRLITAIHVHSASAPTLKFLYFDDLQSAVVSRTQTPATAGTLPPQTPTDVTESNSEVDSTALIQQQVVQEGVADSNPTG